MVWTWESTCSACTFVSGQIGSNTPCPAHAGVWSSAYASARSTLSDSAPLVQPTADQPWPFTRQQFARLLLLRGRVRDRRRAASADAQVDTLDPELRALRFGPTCAPLLQRVHSLYEACMSDEMRMVLAGGLALFLFLVIFALGQLQEILRATSYHVGP
jgi:hypothetical protein